VIEEHNFKLAPSYMSKVNEQIRANIHAVMTHTKSGEPGRNQSDTGRKEDKVGS
jgi:hypothetical protein